jgi:hypothetical protein
VCDECVQRQPAPVVLYVAVLASESEGEPARMPTTITELADDTAFERFVLDRTFPLMPSSGGAASVVDLGKSGSIGVAVTPQPAIARVSVSLSDSSRSPEGQLSVDTVRPLIFGAAWKVLDQLVELALEQAGESHDRGNDYTIKLKTQSAAGGVVPALRPLDRHTAVWKQIMMLFASTAELRNSLAHRQLVVDRSSGAISTTSRPGQPAAAAVTADAQAAFCQLASGAVNAVIAGTISNRQAAQLRWNLDRLGAHHGQPAFGDSSATGLIPRVIVRPTVSEVGDLVLDFAAIRADAASAVGGVSHYDLEIHLPDGRILACGLEEAPTTPTRISVSAPPTWLRWA